MQLLWQVLFALGALIALGGIIILVILAPRPERIEDHLLGSARYMMAAGAAFGMAAVLNGWVPPWHQAIFMLGFAVGMALFARKNHLIALAEELAEEGPDSCA